MNVLSLFDGISMARQALKDSGFKINSYYASEIDKNAIKVSKFNHKDIVHIGDVKDIFYINNELSFDTNKINLNQVDLLIGGSPCQSFSFAGKRKGMITKDKIEILTLESYLECKKNNFEFEGQSYLFWEYVRLLKEIKPKYFLLENVVMDEKWEKLISKTLGVEPLKINSSSFTCQNRPRLYWTNIPCDINKLPNLNITFKEIKQKSNDPSQYYSGRAIDWIVNHSLRKKSRNPNNDCKSLKKLKIYNDNTTINAITLSHNKKYSGQRFFAILDDTYKREDQVNKIMDIKDKEKDFLKLEILTDWDNVLKNKGCYRFITPEECELAQGLPINYTSCVANTSRYKGIGNGFTVPVISWILKGMKK